MRVRLTGCVLICATAFGADLLTVRVEDGTKAPAAGVRVSLQAGDTVSAAYTDPTGIATLQVPAAGPLLLVAEKEHFYTLREARREYAPGTEIHITLQRVNEHAESITVAAASSAVSMDSTSARQSLSSQTVINVPYPNTNDFRSALRSITGVVRDNRGGIHWNGAAEDQVLYTLNGFNLNDPLTGRFESRLSVESVQSVEATTGNVAAEFGKGSAGALAVRTNTGGDSFRPMATNFIPGFENRKGLMIGDWQPRLGLSGPIRRGRAWFSQTADLLYNNTVVRELPKGADRYSGWRLNDLSSLQVSVTPSNVFSASLLANIWSSARTGLTAFDPIETTIDRRTRQWFFTAKDQVYFRNRALLEFGYASNRTFSREIPQGHAMLRFTVDGKRGNHYIDAARAASRDQVLANLFLPSFQAAGVHQWKTGVDLNWLDYHQDLRRTGFENYSNSGQRTRRTVFGGSGRLERSNTEVAAYLQDSWRVRANILVEIGLRADWDRLVERWSPAPRFGVAWAPKRWADTKLYAGVSRIFDATNLRLFSRPLDQYSLTTYFAPEGEVMRGPALQLFQGARVLARPRASNWNAGAAHTWRNGLSMQVDWARRLGSRGFTYGAVDDAEPPAWAAGLGARQVDAIYQLDTFRRDRFQSVAVTVRHVIRRQYEWAGSYTRSRALSNAVVDVAAEDPTTVYQNAGPMPWDAPHRFMGWGYLPMPFKNWALAYFADGRSGFPYSTQNEFGRITGGVNAQRFPLFFELNVHLERRFLFRNHRWAFRAGVNNITDRINPDSVNPFATPARFYGGNGRAVNMRIRWLGRG